MVLNSHTSVITSTARQALAKLLIAPNEYKDKPTSDTLTNAHLMNEIIANLKTFF